MWFPKFRARVCVRERTSFGTLESKPGRQHHSPLQSGGECPGLEGGESTSQPQQCRTPGASFPSACSISSNFYSNSWPATADTDARSGLESAQAGGCFATPVAGLRQSRRMEVFEHSSVLISWGKVFGIPVTEPVLSSSAWLSLLLNLSYVFYFLTCPVS